MHSIKVRSYAKINWTLDVLFRREDGYHELRTILQTVSLYDQLRLEETRGQIETVSNDPSVPDGEGNLAHRAAVALREAAGVRAGARIEIDKRIPAAAGLGGGSSNAAATLLGLSRLWRVDIGYGEMMELARGLGSDVPFFLLGGTALGVGRGEEVYPLEEASSENLLLVNCGVGVSTASAYARLSRLTRHNVVRIMPFTLLAARGIRELPLAARNDLQEVVAAAHPEIAGVIERLKSLGANHALMCGSGATVFGVFDNLETSEQARAEMRADGFWSERVRAIGRREYGETIFDD
ncbi:MAG TPA: 4-(cytidine 5'-diphospho)-2-C-methyl-D-erythritol kinase [Blastocatellia bacterium]|nr:4-(cytidine 5'-diphospho)-2-C-methyl-D-erythritol kinase [Blastocatellia bacterium]